MKKLLALFALTLALTAGAQQYQQIATGWNGTNGWTNTVLASSGAIATNPVNATYMVSATKYGDVGVMATHHIMAAGTGNSNATFWFRPSVDGTNFDSVALWVFRVDPNGTTKQVGLTNFTLGNYGYLHFWGVSNASATALTNVEVRWVLKPKRNG